MKSSFPTAIMMSSLGAALALAASARIPRRNWSFAGKTVLITGGSHGLGLAMAREFAVRGARLVLCARSEAELALAQESLRTEFGADVYTIVCDVSDRGQVVNLIDAALKHYGQIDVLVNNAGHIHVGPFDTMTIQDFQAAMDVMFWGTVHTTLAVLPHMRSRNDGRIVNITSVGAKVSVPHLLPYSCAKFACAAFSEGMRSELAGTRVKVVTIAPGLMRTGSHLNAVFRGAEKGEAGWFSLGASLPLISMSAEKAARQIVSATADGSAERILGMPANLLARFHGLFPGIAVEMLTMMGKALPHGSLRSERGADSSLLQRGWIRAFTRLGRQAAERMLQPGALSAR